MTGLTALAFEDFWASAVQWGPDAVLFCESTLGLQAKKLMLLHGQ